MLTPSYPALVSGFAPNGTSASRWHLVLRPDPSIRAILRLDDAGTLAAITWLTWTLPPEPA